MDETSTNNSCRLVDCARVARTCAIDAETSKMASSGRPNIRYVFGVAVLYSAIASDLTMCS